MVICKLVEILRVHFDLIYMCTRYETLCARHPVGIPGFTLTAPLTCKLRDVTAKLASI